MNVQKVLSLTGLVLLFIASCSHTKRDALQFASIYERVDLNFANAILLKPAEAASPDSPGYKFAPLIIQEVLNTNNSADVSKIFFHESTAVLNGKSHQQTAYVWRHRRNESRPGRMQGIRMTLDSAGLPVIWEVLSDSSDADIVFVSQSVETAALREFGQPLPGRRFAVERSMRDAPKTVVARVIEDGPVPMGPIVYLYTGTQDVGTVICRCMDAQAQTLVATAYFELKPLSAVTNAHAEIVRMDRSVVAKLRLPTKF